MAAPKNVGGRQVRCVTLAEWVNEIRNQQRLYGRRGAAVRCPVCEGWFHVGPVQAGAAFVDAVDSVARRCRRCGYVPRPDDGRCPLLIEASGNGIPTFDWTAPG